MAKPAIRKPKKKANPLKAAKVENIDYKDAALLRKFISDRGKIRARRVTGVSVQEQRLIAQAVKNAREMALLPYTSRVTTQRGRPSRDGDDRPRRPRRDESSEFEALDGDGADTAAEESTDEAVTEAAE